MRPLSTVLLAGALLASAPSPRAAVVRRVVDGDTLVVGRRERVRLIGVDAPEIPHRDRAGEPFGPEAAEFTRSLADGETVRLGFDPEAGRTDRHGRTLAYVTLPDGRLLNLEIIRAGWAEAYHALAYERKAEFLAAERAACEERLGLWAERHRPCRSGPLSGPADPRAVEGRPPQRGGASGLDAEPPSLHEAP